MDEFRKDIEGLDHGRKRTSGIGKVRSKWCRLLSRRAISDAVRLYREERNRQDRAMERRVHWHLPGLVWAVDDTELSMNGIKMNVHNVRDLSSRYTFRPLLGEFPKGSDVAENLRILFREHGAPLFLKRDNGSNLNSKEVDGVLAEFGVIALNSPAYYPPYNGAIENCQRELKAQMQIMYERGASDFQLMAELSAHNLNHRRRDCLKGACSCACLSSGSVQMKAYNLKKRKEVRDQIMALVRQIKEKTDSEKSVDFDTIWRVAVEAWLHRHGLVTVLNSNKCNPINHDLWSH
jgi:transposase InsO family protein